MTVAKEAPRTILDTEKDFFPVQLDVEIPKIRSLLHLSTAKQWDPRVDIDWDALDVSKYTEEQRDAARKYWSRRAWVEYAALAESPVLQIRYAHDDLPSDLALYFAMRTQEESRHAEVCVRMAELLGGYVEEPEQDDFQGTVATHGVRKMALDPYMSVEAILAALVCAAEEIAFDVFRHLADITPDPVARQICTYIMRDEVRHCAFGWRYLDYRMPQLSEEEVKIVENGVINMIEKVELNGYHAPWLAIGSPAAEEEAEIDRITWEAGLGATVEELEKPIFVSSVQRIRRQMTRWGVNLPTFSHPKLGEF